MKIYSRNGVTEILVYEDIGDSFFGGVTAKQVMAALKSAEHDEVLVRLNSPGGDVFEGMAIYNALAQSDKTINTQIDGLAASAASVVFMAGEQRVIAENAFIMIHNAWAIMAGDASEHRSMADALEAISNNMGKVYSDRTGAKFEDVVSWMDAETWFAAEPEGDIRGAIEDGFATSMIPNLRVAAHFDRTKHRFSKVPPALTEPPPRKIVNMRLEKMKNKALDLRI